ncbi:hypothetical protein FHT00_002709 [Sphingomonas insulae]|uniref:OmpA family protein n=1 Tax=Sphingomonas insulae TaxID=424800 RepID=A0ABP3SZ21_9SPHN|nr:hypothetical protein [Sphingomonas insulae]NIJ30736.1 hypothetical protein [Sphingomonas insulae]
MINSTRETPQGARTRRAECIRLTMEKSGDADGDNKDVGNPQEDLNAKDLKGVVKDPLEQ